VEAAEKVINKGVFILPLGNDIYKVGSTYEWDDLTEQPTEKGKAYLIEKLQKVLKIPFEIIDHQAGIRPTVLDRRPLIGLHPQHPALGVFNGMGTKGVMLAPYFAKQLVDFLENNLPLDKEVDIARFK
jgi:glycine/D-amino acid oxidase-like deaminating enzyme